MPAVSMSEVEKQLRERAAELAPLIAEYEEIQAVLASLAAARDGEATGRRETKSAPAAGQTQRPRRRGGRPASAATPRLKGGGARAAQALDLVTKTPGITVAELSEQMGIGTTYLYRVLPALEREGKVVKAGKGYNPAS